MVNSLLPGDSNGCSGVFATTRWPASRCLLRLPLVACSAP